MSYSYKERRVINAALQAGLKAASKPERTLTETEFQELEALAANCPFPVPLKVVRRIAKLREKLAELLQTQNSGCVYTALSFHTAWTLKRHLPPIR